MEPFPLHLYPKKFQDFCHRATANTGCPESFIPAAILPVIGAALGANTVLTVGQGWQERPCIWLALVGESGVGKNPAIDTVTAPLFREDRLAHEAGLLAYQEWKALEKEEQQGVPKPPERHLVVTSPTIESVRKILTGNPAGLLLTTGELSGWVNGMGEYKGGRGADRQLWLDIYSGAPLKATRASQEFNQAIYDPFVCILGGIQPKIIGKLLGADGLHARVLYVVGEGRTVTGLPPIAGQALNVYPDWEQFIQGLVKVREEHKYLGLDLMAHKYASEWKMELDRKHCLDCDKPENWRMVCNKTVGIALRISLLLWAMEGFQGGTITLRQMENAVELATWFLRSAEGALDMADLSSQSQHEDAARLEALQRWVHKKEAEGVTINPRYVYSNGPSWVRSKAKAEEALRNLGFDFAA